MNRQQRRKEARRAKRRMEKANELSRQVGWGKNSLDNTIKNIPVNMFEEGCLLPSYMTEPDSHEDYQLFLGECGKVYQQKIKYFLCRVLFRS